MIQLLDSELDLRPYILMIEHTEFSIYLIVQYYLNGYKEHAGLHMHAAEQRTLLIECLEFQQQHGRNKREHTT
jgi:hypothetical protein